MRGVRRTAGRQRLRAQWLTALCCCALCVCPATGPFLPPVSLLSSSPLPPPCLPRSTRVASARRCRPRWAVCAACSTTRAAPPTPQTCRSERREAHSRRQPTGSRPDHARVQGLRRLHAPLCFALSSRSVLLGRIARSVVPHSCPASALPVRSCCLPRVLFALFLPLRFSLRACCMLCVRAFSAHV